MITDSKKSEMLSHDEIPKNNTLIGAVAPPKGLSKLSNRVPRNPDGSLIVPVIYGSKEKADKSPGENPTLLAGAGKANNGRICTNNELSKPNDSGVAASPPAINTIPYESRCDGIPPKYPKGWEEKDGRIYSDGKPATNHIIRLKRLQTKYFENGDSKLFVQCYFITEGKIVEVDIPYDDLQNGKFKKHLPDGFVVFNVLSKQLEKKFCNSFLQTMADLPNEKTTCLSFGYNTITGRHVFNAGDRLINGAGISNWISDSNVIMRYAKPKPRIVYKDWMFRLSKTNNYPPVLSIATFVPHILPMVDKDKRDRYDFSLYIVGESSCGKTEIAKLLGTPFEGNEHMLSLSSDIDAIHKLSAYKDCTVVIDDLNASDSDEIKRNKEKKLAGVIETKQSIGRDIVDGKNIKIPAMPIITAEYLLKAVGALNRCMIVHIERPFKPSELTWLQENHDTYIAFTNSFIEYICKHFDELQTDVNEYLSTRKYHMKDGEDIPGWQRISNIQFILEATLMVVMKFFGDKDDIPGYFPSFWSPFKESIQECKEYTADLLRKRSMDKEELLMYELVSAIWDPKSGIVTDNKTSFLRDLDNHKKSLPERFVYYHEDKKLFCLRSEDAEQFLDGKMSNRKITQKFDEMELIQTKKSDRTIEIFKKEKSNPFKNVRFICLKQKAIANYLGVENEFLPPNIKDETYKGYFEHSIMTNSDNYSAHTMPEQDETDCSDIADQMCGKSKNKNTLNIWDLIKDMPTE